MNMSHWDNYSDSIADIEDYLAHVLGPKRLPLNWLLPLTSVYGVIFCTGLIGNTCTCLVIATNPYMQTATNCYLFNLAVADMLTLICAMPLELYSLWHQYPWQLGTWTCILRTVIAEATAYASILTIATFSCEQYYAVCHPLRQTTKSKVSRAFRNIVIIWILSIVAAAPYGLFTKVNYITLEPEGEVILESAWCGFPFTDPNRKWETLMLCSTFLFFVVPMTLITALYARISLTLYRARNLPHNPSDGQRARIRSRMVVIRMLITVVLAFFVCWAPYHSQRLLFLYVSLYGEWTETLRKINQDLFTLAGCFYYFNSTINPVLYSVMSNRFRVAFREKLCAGNPCTCFLCCCCCCWERWRDYYQARISSSASSSHRTPHGPGAPAALSPRRPSPPAAALPPFHPEEKRPPFLSLSEEKRPFDPPRPPRFSSDPLKLGRCSSTDSGDFQLALEPSDCNCNNALKARLCSSGPSSSIYEESRM